MAVLHRFPSLYSCRFPLESVDKQQQHHQFLWGNRRFPPRKLIISASSTKNSRVKAGKFVKSNADLCAELREFVSMVGLPEGHVPSFKELSDHGRKDLAHIVRRRGYRLITELLKNSTHADTNAETNSVEKQKDTNICENESVGQDQEGSELAGDLLLSSDGSNTDNRVSCENSVPPLFSGSKTCGLVEPGTNLSFLEKASKFIKDGELDRIEDDDLNIGHGISISNGIDEEIERGSSGGQSLYNEASGNNDTSVINASALTPKLGLPHETPCDDFLSVERFSHTISQKDLDIETSTRDNGHEINRLKAMLHQKEQELYQLKEQIEKEKLALSTLQAKAENEIGKAQKIMSSKDEELHTAEESLSGLKEVQIEYLGHGETVEVAGSFNGWHNRIKMDSQPLSTSARSTEFRKARRWSIVLWLYPGIYEIKFVVDGHWMTDPLRESVARGAIHNNILRVDR